MGFTSLFFCCIFWHFLTPFSGSSLVFAYVVFILIASQQIFMHKYGYINTYTYFMYMYIYFMSFFCAAAFCMLLSILSLVNTAIMCVPLWRHFSYVFFCTRNPLKIWYTGYIGFCTTGSKWQEHLLHIHMYMDVPHTHVYKHVYP